MNYPPRPDQGRGTPQEGNLHPVSLKRATPQEGNLGIRKRSILIGKFLKIKNFQKEQGS